MTGRRFGRMAMATGGSRVTMDRDAHFRRRYGVGNRRKMEGERRKNGQGGQRKKGGRRLINKSTCTFVNIIYTLNKFKNGRDLRVSSPLPRWRRACFQLFVKMALDALSAARKDGVGQALSYSSRCRRLRFRLLVNMASDALSAARQDGVGCAFSCSSRWRRLRFQLLVKMASDAF